MKEMNSEYILEAIDREFPEAILDASETHGMLTIEIKKEEIKKVIHFLKVSSLNFHFLTDGTRDLRFLWNKIHGTS